MSLFLRSRSASVKRQARTSACWSCMLAGTACRLGCLLLCCGACPNCGCLRHIQCKRHQASESPFHGFPGRAVLADRGHGGPFQAQHRAQNGDGKCAPLVGAGARALKGPWRSQRNSVGACHGPRFEALVHLCRGLAALRPPGAFESQRPVLSLRPEVAG